MKKFPVALIVIISVFGTAGVILILYTFFVTNNITVSFQLNVGTDNEQVKTDTWSCGDGFTDSRDGTAYTTVLIGTQCWMAKNLDYGTRVDGSVEQTNNSTVEKYCYSDSTGNCTTYGGLYQWDEMMDYNVSCNGSGEGSEACTSPVQGICPESWHVPSHYEYVALEREVCTSGTCASDFPYDTSTIGYNPGTDEGTSLKQNGNSGFEGLLAGNRNTDDFFGLGTIGHFWSSLESTSSAWHWYLLSSNATVDRNTNTKARGFSVRCIRD